MSVQVKGSGTIGGLDEGLVVSGIVTSSTQINVGSNIKLGNAGIVTATSLDISGDIDVDGHTNLDNVSIAGIVTVTNTGDNLLLLNSTSGSAKIKFYENGNNRFNIETLNGSGGLMFYDVPSGTERARIDASGRVLIGQTSSINGIFGSPPPRFSVSTNQASPAIFATYSNNSYASRIDLIKSRNATVGSHTVVQDGDGLGEIYFGGSDGDQFHGGALIQAVVESGVGNDDMPANLRFYTNGGATTVTERLRIDSLGNIGMNTTTASDSTGNCRAYTFSRSDANGQVRLILKNIATGFGNGAGFHQGIDGANVFIENRTNGGYLDFTTNNSGSIETRVRITSGGDVGVNGGSDIERKVDIVTSNGNSVLIRPNTGGDNAQGNANVVNNSLIFRMPYGENAGSSSNAGARIGIVFTGRNDGSGYVDNPSKSASVYGISEDDSAGYTRKMGLGFFTSPFDAAQTEKMRISANGYVTTPLQPAFAARLGTNTDITSNTGNDLVFSVQEFDNSSNYNTSNGRFTAPVAGKYYFGVQIYAGFNGAGVRVMHASFRVNGTSVAQTDMFGGASNHGGTHYHPTAVGHMFRNLNANDYVTFNLGGFSHTGGQAILYASTGNRFFGYLVG